MTTNLQDDLATMTIRELLVELTLVEDRLNSQRAASGYQATTESARLQRRVRAISAHLRQRRSEQGAAGMDPAVDADEADRIEQSIPVETDPEEEYPHQQAVGTP